MRVIELINELEKMDSEAEVTISVDVQNQNVHHRIFCEDVMEVMDNKGEVVILCNQTSKNF